MNKMEDAAFSNMEHTPAWYWKKWPGFLNVEAYYILAAWDKGVRDEEEWIQDRGVEEEKEGVMEYSQNTENKKRKICKGEYPDLNTCTEDPESSIVSK